MLVKKDAFRVDPEACNLDLDFPQAENKAHGLIFKSSLHSLLESVIYIIRMQGVVRSGAGRLSRSSEVMSWWVHAQMFTVRERNPLLVQHSLDTNWNKRAVMSFFMLCC